MSIECNRMIQDFCAAKNEGEAMRVWSCTWDMDRGFFDDRKNESCPIHTFNDIALGNYFHLSPDTFSIRYDKNLRILTVWDSLPCGAYQVYQVYYSSEDSPPSVQTLENNPQNSSVVS